MKSTRHFPDWIEAYTALFDGRTEAPAKFHFFTACATISGALTRRVWIEENIFRIFANQFIGFVAEPAIMNKSTTIRLGMDMLRQLDHVYMAADRTTYPAFIQDLAKRSSEVLDDPQADGEMEDALWIRQCAVTAAISELGTFFKVEDEDMVNGLTDLWDCGSIMVNDTKTAGTDIIEHPFVNLIAGTTPTWARTKLKAVGGWGISSRFLFVFSDTKTKLIARPSKLWQKGQFERETKRLVDDLREISNLNGGMKFTKAADDLAHSWYEQHAQRAVEHNTSEHPDPWLGWFLARKQIHVHKLAIILSASRRDSLSIEEIDLLDSIKRIDEVEAEIPRIFTPPLEQTPLARTEQEMLARLRAEMELIANRTLPRLVVFAKIAHYVDSSTANKIIDGAVARRVFKQINHPGGVAFLELL